MMKFDLLIEPAPGSDTGPLLPKAKISLADRLAQALARQIASGALKHGEQLPTEAELCKRHGVSRITVRRALDQLQQSGLIDRYAGKGTFVAGRGAIANWRLESVQDLIEATAYTRTKVLRWETDKPIAEARNFLLSGNQKIWIYHGVRYLKRMPAYVVEAFIPLSIGDRITRDDLVRQSPIELFEHKLDMPVQRAIEEIGAARAEPRVAELLKIETGDPVMTQTLRFYGPGGPLQYLRAWWHSKYFRRRYELTRR